MELRMIPTDLIRTNPFQPRMDFEKESLQELADSFKEKGVLEPIIVRKLENGYQLIAGERRWRAATLAGLKEIPAVIRKTSAEGILIESLMENIHRTNLTDIERENAIHELWVSGKFETKSEMAKALCLKRKIILDDIDAWEFRRKNKVSGSVPTYIIARTSGLKEEERRNIISKFESNEFRAIDVYSVVKTVKKASDLLRKELFSPESTVTPEIAEVIVENLPDHSAQNAVTREVKHRRLVVSEVENLVRIVWQNEKVGNMPSRIIGEIDSGYLFKCPVCNQIYRIFHNEPTNTHSLREMS